MPAVPAPDNSNQLPSRCPPLDPWEGASFSRRPSALSTFIALKQPSDEGMMDLIDYLRRGDDPEVLRAIAQRLPYLGHPAVPSALSAGLGRSDIALQSELISSLAADSQCARMKGELSILSHADYRQVRHLLIERALFPARGYGQEISESYSRDQIVNSLRSAVALEGHLSEEDEAPLLRALMSSGITEGLANLRTLYILSSLVSFKREAVLSRQGVEQLSPLLLDYLRNERVYVRAAKILDHTLDVHYLKGSPLGPDYGRPVREAAIGALEERQFWGREPEERTRLAAAAWLLRHFRNDSAVRKLLHETCRDQDPLVRWMSGAALDPLSQRVYEQVSGALIQPSAPEQREAAIAFLSWHFDHRTDNFLAGPANSFMVDTVRNVRENGTMDAASERHLVALLENLQDSLWEEGPDSSRSLYFLESFSSEDPARHVYGPLVLNARPKVPLMLPPWLFETRRALTSITGGLRKRINAGGADGQRAAVLMDQYVQTAEQLYGIEISYGDSDTAEQS